MKTELTPLASQFRPVTLSYRYKPVDLSPLSSIPVPDLDALSQRQDALIEQAENTRAANIAQYESWLASKALTTAPGYFQSAKLLQPTKR